MRGFDISLVGVAALAVSGGCASAQTTPDLREEFAASEIEQTSPEPVRPDLSGAVGAFASDGADRTWLGAVPRAMGSDDTAAASEAPTGGGNEEQELAKKLSNPIASLISVPFQSNWDSGMGPDGRGKQYVLRVQPVIPISLNDDWNVISRTIVPIIDQENIVPGTGGQSGVGDITQSFFFSPKAPTDSGWIWGAGPVVLIPTAENDYLGADKWGAGPTAVFLKQESGWTYGALVNHIWSFAGNGQRNEINASFVQPFLSYTTPDVWTFTLNAEATYDWLGDDLGVPVNLAVSKLVRFGKLPVQFQVGARYWAERTEFGAEGFGFRFTITFLLPSGARKKD